MASAQQRLDAAAQRVSRDSGTGVAAASAAATPPSALAAAATGPAAGDLAIDLVDAKAATYAFSANLQTVVVSDRILGTLLDVTA